MDYKTKSGYTITDALLDALGDALEKGDYPGEAGRFVVAPVGRPPIFPEDELVTVAFKIPRSYKEKLDAKAKTKNETRSEFLRDILGDALAT